MSMGLAAFELECGLLEGGRRQPDRKPRQCTTDERWWTAGRIDGNPSSLSGACNRYR